MKVLGQLLSQSNSSSRRGILEPERHPSKLSAYIGQEAVMATPGASASLQIAQEPLRLDHGRQPEDVPPDRSSVCTAFISIRHSQRKEDVFRLVSGSGLSSCLWRHHIFAPLICNMDNESTHVDLSGAISYSHIMDYLRYRTYNCQFVFIKTHCFTFNLAHSQGSSFTSCFTFCVFQGQTPACRHCFSLRPAV